MRRFSVKTGVCLGMLGMIHAVAGRLRPDPLDHHGPVARGRPVFSRLWLPLQRAWKCTGRNHPSVTLLLALVLSTGLHLLIFFGFNSKATPVRIIAEPESERIQIVLPDLKELDEPEKVDQLGDDEAVETPGVAVPMLADLPTIVPVNAFVQALDYRPPVEVDLNAAKLLSVPVHISRGGRADVEKLGQIFDLSQLDREPQPMAQPSPIFPSTLKREYSEGIVTVELIVNSKGDVVVPFVLRKAIATGFDQVAVVGVEKWKFRPGLKAGHKVNTRMQVEIRFRLNPES